MSNAVLDAVYSAKVEPGWAVFHCSPVNAIFSLVWRLIFIALCGIAVYMFSFMETTLASTSQMTYFSFFFGAIALVLLYGFLRNVRELLMAHKTILVITDTQIVKSYCGKVETFRLAELNDLKLVQYYNRSIMPSRRIEAYDSNSGKHVEIATRRIWGDESKIFQVINSKLV